MRERLQWVVAGEPVVVEVATYTAHYTAGTLERSKSETRWVAHAQLKRYGVSVHSTSRAGVLHCLEARVREWLEQLGLPAEIDTASYARRERQDFHGEGVGA